MEGIINSLPAYINDHRDKDDLYDIDEAYRLLRTANLLQKTMLFNWDVHEKLSIYTHTFFQRLSSKVDKMMHTALTDMR